MSSSRFMNSVDFDTHRSATDLVLIPLGAIEIYGPHLPLGADGIAAQALSDRVAEREPAFVAPLIPVGYSKSFRDFPGTLWVEPSSLVAYTRDIAQSYIHWGCKRLLFINGHGGNVPFLAQLSLELEDTYGVRCAMIDWWRFIQPLSEDLAESDARPHGHAAEFGTSVMLHLAPEHVKVDRLIRDMPTTVDEYAMFLRPNQGRDRSPTGVQGDSRLGTAKKGEEVMNRAVERVLEFLQSEHFRSAAS